MAALDLPLPPELAAPEPDADAWVPILADAVVAMANEAGLDADAAGGMLAGDTAEGAADFAEWVPDRARRWTVTDDGSAEWAMRHVAAAEAELRTLREQADAWAYRIHQWYEQRAKPLQATKGFMAAHLERYALERRLANPKAKTLTLPSGKVATTYVAPKVEVDDADAVVAWAEANGLAEVVRVRKEPKVSELRRHVTVAEVTVGWDVYASCGCVYAELGTDPPPVGAGCASCGDGQVSTLVPTEGRLVAMDAEGHPVPGAVVAPERTTATAKAERP